MRLYYYIWFDMTLLFYYWYDAAFIDFFDQKIVAKKSRKISTPIFEFLFYSRRGGWITTCRAWKVMRLSTGLSLKKMCHRFSVLTMDVRTEKSIGGHLLFFLPGLVKNFSRKVLRTGFFPAKKDEILFFAAISFFLRDKDEIFFRMLSWDPP